jgi:hypothetical protein
LPAWSEMSRTIPKIATNAKKNDRPVGQFIEQLKLDFSKSS